MTLTQPAPSEESIWDAGAPQRSVSPLAAARRHPFLVAACVVILAAAAAASVFVSTPTYTATSALNVGNEQVRYQAVPSYVTAAQNLAAGYARAITATPVLQSISTSTNVGLAEVAKSVSASPIPNSPVIEITAESSNRARSVALANAAAAALLDYVRNVLATDDQTKTSLAGYTKYQRDYVATLDEIAAVRADLRSSSAGPRQVRLKKRLLALETEQNTLRLRRDAFAVSYQAALNNHPSSDFIKLLANARSAASNRSHNLQLRLLTGAVAGLLLGLALATALVNRRRRRLG